MNTHPAAKYFGGLIAAVGFSVLTGWAFDIPLLKSIHPSFVTMKVNTALGFLSCGTALLLLSKTKKCFPLALGAFAALIGLLTLIEYGVPVDLGIDQILFQEPAGAVGTHYLGRMAPGTAFNFLISGLAIGLFHWKTKRNHFPAEYLSLVAGIIGYLGLATYVFNVEFLYAFEGYTKMALHTSILFIFLSLGNLFLNPHGKMMTLILGKHAGGLTARRLLPAAFLIPLFLGWLRWKGQMKVFYGTEAGISLFAVSIAIVLMALILWTAKSIYQIDLKKSEVEEQLKNSEEKSRLIVETANDAFIGMNINGVITDWNAQAELLFGWKREEALGRILAETIIPPEMRELHKKGLAHFLATGQGPVLNKRIELTALHRDGHKFPVELTVWPVKTKDTLLFNAFLHDITEKKEAESLLQKQAQELQRSNTELEQFAYVASHDLQEPLRMVSSYTELLSRRYKNQLDPQADEFIYFAADGAKRMSQLIQSLLEYSRAGRKTKPFQPVDLKTIWEKVIWNLQMLMNETKAEITHDPLPTISGDPIMLIQLLQNLVVNAIKFRGDQPPKIHFGVQQKKEVNFDGWFFSVKDNGIGFDPQYSERIFQIFQRLHPRKDYPGIGIGLAICKKIVEVHGGKIWAESRPGQGSTFFLTFPIVTLSSSQESGKGVKLKTEGGTYEIGERKNR